MEKQNYGQKREFNSFKKSDSNSKGFGDKSQRKPFNKTDNTRQQSPDRSEFSKSKSDKPFRSNRSEYRSEAKEFNNSQNSQKRQHRNVPDKKSGNHHDLNAEVRLNKFIAEVGYCSRRKADDIIKEGRVKVDGRIITELGEKIKRNANVFIDGNQIRATSHLTYVLLNKPKDFISTVSDEKGRKTVLDIVRIHDRLYPVGRLDRNTTGALLLTNDGEMAFRLTHPSYQIERSYIAGLDKPLKLDDAKAISEGVELEDGKTGPIEVFVNPEDPTLVSLTLREGKNREIRRIFESFGYFVRKLDRKVFAGLTCRGLARGEYRHLNKMELLELRKLVKLRK